MPLHDPPGAGQRARSDQRRQPGGSQAQKPPSATAQRTWDCRRVRRPARRSVARRCKGLRLPNRDSSGDPATRAAEVGCARGFSGPMEGARR